MLNKRYLLLIICCCLPLLGAVKPASFTITGIEGDMLLNVQNRLIELYKKKAITSEPEEALRLQVEKAMYPYGFFKPQISISESRKNIHINPGPPLPITSISIKITGEGINNLEIRKVIHTLPIKAGNPLNNALYNDSKDMILTVAEHQGYLHASFEKSQILIDRQQYTAKITIIFNTGPQYYFGQVRFDPTYISPELLARYVPFKAGQPYSTEQVLALNNNLATSGYFNVVNVKPLIQQEKDVPIDIHLQRVNRINYSVGAGYGTDTGLRGRLGLHVVPVNRYGHKFNAIAQGSFNENALQAQYIIPGTNPVTDKYSISGGLSNLNYNSGNSTSETLSFAQQHAVTHFQRILSINGLIDRYNYFAQNKTQESLVYPKAIFTWSKTSDRLFSPSGYNFTVTGLAANKAILSNISMAQASIDGKVAINVEAIRTRFFLHAIQGGTLINDIDKMPLSLAQLLGGAENLRGYSYNGIGPGKTLSYGGIEIQKETFKKWYFTGFFDCGDIYNPTMRQTKYDVGVGLMWVSPLGPIKVGIAQAVDNHLGRLSNHQPKLVVNMGPDL